MDESHSPKSLVENEFQSTLRSAPSFEIYNKSHENHGDYDNDPEEVLKRTAALTKQSLEASGSCDFSFEKSNMDLNFIEESDCENDWSNGIQNLSVVKEEKEEDEDEDDDVKVVSPRMYLATGFGVSDKTIDDIFTPSLKESEDLGEYYKRMVDEYPCHPFILNKYAHFLQSKGELEGAEEYFHRASLADPNDGENLMHYARLLWENHHDRDRAIFYFERAAQAAPQDSNVLAAYASFLWEIDDDDEDNEYGVHEIQSEVEKTSNENDQEVDAANLATACSEDSNVADYLKKMVDENLNNPLFLKKYAQFLFQSKRDLEAAEDYYYSQAKSADPSDGEMISEYARLEWELHHDQEKAVSLFEQAVQATPGDSNVLAAYACFLWEREDEES